MKLNREIEKGGKKWREKKLKNSFSSRCKREDPPSEGVATSEEGVVGEKGKGSEF